MNKYIASFALVLAVSSTGCATTVGGLVGSSMTSTEVTRAPDGTRITRESSAVVPGILIGALVDAVLIVAASSAAVSSSNTCWVGCGGY